MYKSYIPYLQHILDECHYVLSVISPEMQREEFLQDETLKRLPLIIPRIRNNLASFR